MTAHRGKLFYKRGLKSDYRGRKIPSTSSVSTGSGMVQEKRWGNFY